MKNFREIKRLKIVEQIILVLLLAVIVPTTVCAIIINNINQHAVRNELQYSAMSISKSIASNIETSSSSGREEISQIILSLRHIPSEYAQKRYLKDMEITSSLIDTLELIKRKEIGKEQ